MIFVLISTWDHHDHALLLLAAAIWIAGSFSLFMLLQRALEFGVRRQRQWLAVSATSGGIGVWATHFVAMLSHDDSARMSYDIGLTALSIFEVTTCFWFALRIFTSAKSLARQIAAGAVAAIGVATMHFTGMSAIGGVTPLAYAPVPMVWAGLVSLLGFVGAFIAFARTKALVQVAGPALLAIVSVCALHFTAMSGTTLCSTGTATAAGGGLDRAWLTAAVVVATGLLVASTVLAMLLDRYLTDLRGFADATLEGLAIVQGDIIVETNDRFAEMLGCDRAALQNSSPADWLATLDGRALLSSGGKAVEVVLAAPDTEGRSFEIATHPIEYRGRDCLVLALRDLTERKAAQRQIEHMARHDALTDLPNRTLLDERLEHALTLARRDDAQVALIALDLDRFKAVNDVFGHAAGDEVLRRVASLLARAARSTDTVARIGGDEFVILQVGAAQPRGAQALVNRIFESFVQEMDVARDPTAVGVSMGVALFPNDAGDADGLRHGADIALYQAKQAGRGAACFFDADMDAAVRKRRGLEHDLRHAILRRQMHIAFQPLVNTADGRISGYEALMRWDHPEQGEIPPSTFVPIAEDTGAIVSLGEWILREACQTAMGWPQDLFLAVNVSPIQFQMPNLAETVEAILRETGFPADRLELEITESVLMRERATVLATLNRLKRQGVRIVMDDFGTGFSSLSNLQIFPFDKIKIDRSFVSAMEEDPAARSIIRAIVSIGRSLALGVVAEGVETEAQRRMVIEEGCPLAQGFLFGRPQRRQADESRIGAAA